MTLSFPPPPPPPLPSSPLPLGARSRRRVLGVAWGSKPASGWRPAGQASSAATGRAVGRCSQASPSRWHRGPRQGQRGFTSATGVPPHASHSHSHSHCAAALALALARAAADLLAEGSPEGVFLSPLQSLRRNRAAGGKSGGANLSQPRLASPRLATHLAAAPESPSSSGCIFAD